MYDGVKLVRVIRNNARCYISYLDTRLEVVGVCTWVVHIIVLVDISIVVNFLKACDIFLMRDSSLDVVLSLLCKRLYILKNFVFGILLMQNKFGM